jgi:predicted RNA-binding Zn-ribbon protein involved in translation (DUF1610 family)
LNQAKPTNFEYRRIQIWQMNRLLVICSVAALALMVALVSMLNMPAQLSWTAAMLAGGLVTVTMVRVVRALNLLYRCPNCGVLPYRTLTDYKCGGLGPSRANFMSPRTCPQCGTRIR